MDFIWVFLISSLTSTLTSWLSQLASLVRQLLFCSFEVKGKNNVYCFVMHKVKTMCRTKSAIYVGLREVDQDPVSATAASSAEDELIPSNGVVLFLFDWHIFVVTVEHSLSADFGLSRKLIISQLGWSETALLRFIQSCRKEHETFMAANSQVSVYVQDGGIYWDLYTSKKPRPLSSVIFPNDLAQAIYRDVTTFLESKQYYEDRFLPYYRTWLLHSAPGCGKSSFIQALASELDFSVSILSLSDESLTDQSISRLMSNTFPKSIIILEDVDAAFNTQKTIDDDDQVPGNKRRMEKRLTFSGLLNALDGVSSNMKHARLIFMTTNHLDRLDPALIRPGRVDKIYHIPLADADQMRRLFLRFFPGESKLARTFSQMHPEGKWSMAALQSHLMTYRDDPEAAATKELVVQ